MQQTRAMQRLHWNPNDAAGISPPAAHALSPLREGFLSSARRRRPSIATTGLGRSRATIAGSKKLGDASGKSSRLETRCTDQRHRIDIGAKRQSPFRY
jgi:hypothetical protein